MADTRNSGPKKSQTAKDRQRARSEQIEEQLAQAAKRRQERQFLEELGKRVSIAREGRAAIEKKNFAAAMTAYRRFLTITAKAFDQDLKDIDPSKFEAKNRIGESMLISQIFFDLLRMLDKIETDTAKEERMLYHRLFVRFTKGMPFQHFAAENLRKHLLHASAIRHKKEFWATYKALEVRGFCIVATWAFDSANAPEIFKLRQFRDHTLARSAWGRLFVQCYYRHGEYLAMALAKLPGSKPLVRRLLRIFSQLLRG